VTAEALTLFAVVPVVTAVVVPVPITTVSIPRSPAKSVRVLAVDAVNRTSSVPLVPVSLISAAV